MLSLNMIIIAHYIKQLVWWDVLFHISNVVKKQSWNLQEMLKLHGTSSSTKPSHNLSNFHKWSLRYIMFVILGSKTTKTRTYELFH